MTRCPTCPSPDYPCVPNVGPTPCPILFLGAGPGQREAQTREPYSGKAGQELTETYLPLANLRRDRVHIHNAVLCYDGQDKVPNEKRVRECAMHHLPRLLDKVKPELVVLMGGVTQRLADTRIRLDMHSGRPIWTGLLNKTWEGWVWPVNEPALGMRDTPQMSRLLEDFRHLGEWRNGEWTPPDDDDVPWAKKDYRLAKNAKQVRDYFDAYL